MRLLTWLERTHNRCTPCGGSGFTECCLDVTCVECGGLDSKFCVVCDGTGFVPKEGQTYDTH